MGMIIAIVVCILFQLLFALKFAKEDSVFFGAIAGILLSIKLMIIGRIDFLGALIIVVIFIVLSNVIFKFIPHPNLQKIAKAICECAIKNGKDIDKIESIDISSGGFTVHYNSGILNATGKYQDYGYEITARNEFVEDKKLLWLASSCAKLLDATKFEAIKDSHYYETRNTIYKSEVNADGSVNVSSHPEYNSYNTFKVVRKHKQPKTKDKKIKKI